MARSRPLPNCVQYGGTINVFRGRRFQRGHGIGGVLKGLFRSAMPLIKKGAKSLGNLALETGAQVAKDVMAGENIKSSVKRRGKQAGKTLVERAIKNVSQKGNGRKTRRNQPRKRRNTAKNASCIRVSARATSRPSDIFNS